MRHDLDLFSLFGEKGSPNIFIYQPNSSSPTTGSIGRRVNISNEMAAYTCTLAISLICIFYRFQCFNTSNTLIPVFQRLCPYLDFFYWFQLFNTCNTLIPVFQGLCPYLNFLLISLLQYFQYLNTGISESVSISQLFYWFQWVNTFNTLIPVFQRLCPYLNVFKIPTCQYFHALIPVF